MENELMADFPSSSNFSSSGSKKPQLLLFIATTDGQVAEVATLSLHISPPTYTPLTSLPCLDTWTVWGIGITIPSGVWWIYSSPPGPYLAPRPTRI